MQNQHGLEKFSTSDAPLKDISTKNPSLLQLLQSDNECLRGLVVSLSASILRRAVREHPRNQTGDRHSANSEDLLNEAENCFACARISGTKAQIAEGLESAGHDLMAKAVAIETAIQRKKWKV